MKLSGGFLPKIAGRPSGDIEELSLPNKLYVSLQRHGVQYSPVVTGGQAIRFGDALAEASTAGGTLVLPSPASGNVVLDKKDSNVTQRLILEVTSSNAQRGTNRGFQPQRTTNDVIREALAKCGIWPFFWSSRTGRIPTLGDEERPRAIIVNCILTEPFRARGKVILRNAWNRIVQGIKFLPRLMEDYSTIEVVLTDRSDPVARMMYLDLAGLAWVRFHAVPLLYPIENPRILTSALKNLNRFFTKNDVIWVIDVQGMEALGACLAEGLPLHQRIVAIGGPGHTRPRHVSVRVGTPVKSLIKKTGKTEKIHVLRGGIFKGEPVDPETDSVQYDDDAFFFLPEVSYREFLSFMRLGFDRTSISPCFVSRITGAADKHISTSLRGERRPCIACGRCEEICPARLMPQVLHRFLYREALDEAESAGLHLCVECGLCTFVCPSKIELEKQLMEAKRQLHIERHEAEAAAMLR